MSEKVKEFAVKAIIRAVYTFAEVALSMLTVGQAFVEIDWIHILSVSGVAAIYSILKSIVVGLPEVEG